MVLSRLMGTSYRLHGIRATGYGYGFFIRNIRGKAAIGHGSDIGGFGADVMRFPQGEISSLCWRIVMLAILLQTSSH